MIYVNQGAIIVYVVYKPVLSNVEGGIPMALANNEIFIFVNKNVLQTSEGLEKLRSFLERGNILKNTIVRGYEDDGIVSVPPKLVQQKLTLADDISAKNLAFYYFVQQKIMDGYIYVSVESLQQIVDSLLGKIDALKKYVHHLEEMELSK